MDRPYTTLSKSADQALGWLHELLEPESDFDAQREDVVDAANACILQATSDVASLCFDSIDHALSENDEFPVWERVVIDPVLASVVLTMENIASAICRVIVVADVHAIVAVLTDYNDKVLTEGVRVEARTPEQDYCDSPY